MLGRRRTIALRNGVELRTPLVIPSLSTRNVARIDIDGTPESISSAVLRLHGNQLTESMLVSAYDLHRRNLHDADRLLAGATDTVFGGPELFMIDSGLYETRERVGYDDGVAADVGAGWTDQTYAEVLAALPDAPAAIVNFDALHAPYDDQIAAARELFAEHDTRARVMLLKPEVENGFIDAARLSAVGGALPAREG